MCNDLSGLGLLARSTTLTGYADLALSVGLDPMHMMQRAKVPTDAQAAIAAVFLATGQRVDELETRVRDLEARLKLNSTNSSKPPSSDPIGMKRKPPAPPSGKKRGGQPGPREP